MGRLRLLSGASKARPYQRAAARLARSELQWCYPVLAARIKALAISRGKVL